ncbi:23S rRNA (adenine(2503)-C(2))-methyltransferase RlmN [Nesterenkonia alkaliphila]|uniref:Probable dual-specificity RNA methyltransferase RlmN n=2 Tax=Nesterenkonia alkaliphila TaxID=1463631 RepID=A0A7K1UKG3_9MICC|nr:23S rRNA (adenine(2503)-C(2))-methyltransferase RlmN [Nesterenkonia alkaliphila]MVT26959.1 23S rRNA (adenine(2503)-C(2))-methyltransferase RlmN [Nesterenkonia alkaliphila]GFZ90363.1 putative dual-specificity RNA methyltransferase RlmN [Nesterenkonia alkaliphila]
MSEKPAPAPRSSAARPQVKPRAEGWTQAVDAEGRPKLQFAQSKRVKQPPTHLADLSLDERIAWAKEMGLPGFRAKQLSVHYFQHYTSDPEQMTDLPAETREQLVAEFLPPLLTEVRRLKTDDGATIKFLWRLFDGALVESVLMRYRSRITLCISSQCGCGMNCPFCATGQNGLTRNMSTAEIVDQIVQANRAIAAGELDPPTAEEVREESDHAGLGEESDFAEGEAAELSPIKDGATGTQAVRAASSSAQGEKAGPQRVSNMVFMGMGEPLANYKRVMNAVRRMIDPAPEGLGMSARGITVSTVGLVPAIRKLADENLPITFALSLHAPDDELRDELIPVNSRWKADEAIDAARYYYETTGRRVSIEYALIKDMNDHPWRADLLAEKLNARGRGWVHVNPIPLNPTPNSVWTSSEPKVMQEFIDRLNAAGVPTTLRDTRGKEIDGACGQLAASET